MQRREFVVAGMAGIAAIVTPIENLANELHDEQLKRQILAHMATFREECQVHFEEMEMRIYAEYDRHLNQRLDYVVSMVDDYLRECEVTAMIERGEKVPDSVRETAKHIARYATPT